MTCRPHLSWILAGATALLAGCGADAGNMVSVTGRVTWEGAPATTGNVTFTLASADTNGPARLATGQIQPDGTFVMSTLKQNDGVLPGTYRVAINSDPPPRIEVIEGQKLPKGPVPASYADPATSGLEVAIESGADPRVQDFALPK